MSPTDSEFSDGSDGLTGIRAWDENKVGEWLHSIRCGSYEPMFKAHNFTGESLLECDVKILAEMGIRKIGDRVRINVAIKQLRNKSMTARRRRNMESMAALDAMSMAPAESPRLHPRYGNKRLDGSGLKNNSRPTSPLADTHMGGLRSKYALASPAETSKREASNGYFIGSQPNSAATTSGRRPETPQIVVQHSFNKSHLRQNSSMDGLTPGGLPSNSPVIKIVHNGGQTKVVNVKFCKSADEVTMTVLKKVLIPEKHYRNYCFYVLEGLEARQANCRRLSDEEFIAICGDASRSERNRLILRKINDGLPDLDEVKKAAKLASDENAAIHQSALNHTNMRNQIKLQQLTGESWSNIQAPLSPGPMTDRHQDILARADEIEREEGTATLRPRTAQGGTKLRDFFGARPPSEMIVNELTTYFPGHQKEDIEKTMRMSVRRSQRLSRAASRLSVVSNVSMASSLRDAPPVPAIPSIADAWLTKPGEAGIGAKPRPLSVSRFTSYRDSIASSSLSPLTEAPETPITPIEPNRKSYVSFADTDSMHPDSRLSYFDDSPLGTENLNERLSMIVAEDGEEADPELANFLSGNNFEQNNWMKGDLIGEGSFGSVYLALHAITGELMAVKQVELVDVGKGTESDKKKQLMVNALKLEIELLQGLHHPHIVRYLGTSSDETHLNIFLEYVPGGSIAAMLKQYNTFKEPLTRNFTRQILDGLSYLHSRDIIHRDIKGANILVDNRGAVKISDFGVSKQTTSNLTTKDGINSSGKDYGPLGGPGTRTSLQGSVFWMAPEVVRQTGQSIKSDIWSVGCLIVEMFTGSRPFPSMTTLQTLFAVGSQGEKPQIPDSASSDARRFLDLCFEVDQNKRPSATELLKEPFCGAMIAGLGMHG